MIFKALLLFMFLVPGVFAQTKADLDLLSEKLARVQAMTSSLKPGDYCAPEEKRTCTFNSFCQDYAGKALQPHLYKNSKNEVLPNYLLLSINSQLSRCAGIPETRLVEDPIMYPQDLLMGEQVLPEHQRAYQAKVKRSEDIFTEAKSRMLKILKERKAREPTRSKNFDNMILRIEAVRLETLAIQDEKTFLARGCESPNAYYNDRTAQVVICPQMMAIPEAGLFSVISHEIAHAIDPCSMDNQLTYAGKQAPGLLLSENPLKSVVKCLASSDSMNIRGVSKEEVRLGLAQDLEYLRMLDRPEQIPVVQKKLKNLDKAHEDALFCSPALSNRHIRESFSDWMSLQVVTQKMAEMPEGILKDEFGHDAHSFHQALGCPQIALEIAQSFENIHGKKAYMVCRQLAYPSFVVSDFDSRKTYSENYPGVGDSHPAPDSRVTNIFMAEPALRKANKCKATSSSSAKSCR